MLIWPAAVTFGCILTTRQHSGKQEYDGPPILPEHEYLGLY